MWTPELLRWFGQNILAGAATAGVGALFFAVARDLGSSRDKD